MDECAVRTTHGGGAGPPQPFRCPFTSATWSPKLHFYSIKTIFYSSFFAAMRTAREDVYFYFCGYTRGDMFLLFMRARGEIHLLLSLSTVLPAGSRWKAKTLVAEHALSFARKRGL